MIIYVDTLCTSLVSIILPLIGFRIILDYARIILFKD